MGCLAAFSIGTVLVAIPLGYFFYSLGSLPDLPEVQLTYWGPGKEKPDDKTIKKFKISISDKELRFLEAKLNTTRELVPPLEEVGFTYGFNTDALKEILEFWKTKYDWRERENFFNSFPQYTTQIGGLNIHFLHVKPDPAKLKGQKVIPLLLLHGWPGSVVEFYKIIPMLTSPRADADFVFEIIAPSLPGFGFSQGASKPGLGPAQMGAIFSELMERLGFSKFYIQGGDWGSTIGFTIAVLSPQRVLGFHSNFCAVYTGSLAVRYRTLLVYLFPSLFLDESKIELFQNQFVDTFLLEMGYFHIQATKPDTVGVGLTDSPAGLAAYILEKFSSWTKRDFRNLSNGGLNTYNKVDLIDNVMFYWFPRSITTAMRLYSEYASRKYQNLQIDLHPVTVPIGCAEFPEELMYYPQYVYEGVFQNIVTFTELPVGGHFAAFERPEILAADVWKFVKTLKFQGKTKKGKKSG